MKKSNLALGMALCLFCAGVGFSDPPDIKEVPNTVIQLPLTGKVTVIDLKKHQIEVKADFGKEVSVLIDKHMQVLRDGKVVTLKQLNPGDTIVVMTRK